MMICVCKLINSTLCSIEQNISWIRSSKLPAIARPFFLKHVSWFRGPRNPWGSLEAAPVTADNGSHDFCHSEVRYCLLTIKLRWLYDTAHGLPSPDQSVSFSHPVAQFRSCTASYSVWFVTSLWRRVWVSLLLFGRRLEGSIILCMLWRLRSGGRFWYVGNCTRLRTLHPRSNTTHMVEFLGWMD